jgi:hypothetical protein
MTRPESLFEAASYDLNKFRERRMADRRFMARDTPDRRKSQSETVMARQHDERSTLEKGSNDDAPENIQD